jgi:hypothetical protein
MTIVLGRGTVPGFALPTTLLDAKTLQAQVPAPFAGEADDLFAAVLSADGTSLSQPIPYPRPSLVSIATSANPGDPDLTISTISPGIDPAEAASVTRFAPSETGITSVNGDLVETIGVAASHPQQYLTINGTNLSDGMQVDFKTLKGGQLLDLKAPLTSTQTVASLSSSNDLPPISPTSLMRSKVAVPSDIVDSKLDRLQLKSSGAQSNSPIVSPDPATVIPFGGRVSFQVYEDPGGGAHIEAVSRTPATYQPVTNAVLSIADAAPNPMTGFPTIKLERESGDQLYFARIRGTGLTQLPCGAIVVLNAYFNALHSPNQAIACDFTPRAHAQLKANVNGKAVTRDVVVMPTSLGHQYLEYDALAQYYGDLYGVPPNYLKSQAVQESNYTKNFRFEFTTINVGCLSGDLGQATADDKVCDGFPKIPNEPWSHYAVSGTSLGTYRPKSTDKTQAQESQPFAFHDASQIEFDLGVPIKRTVGGVLNSSSSSGVEVANEVSARILKSDGTLVRNLTQEHLETVWQKGGNGSAVHLSPGVDVQAGVCSPGGIVNPATLSLAANQFAVCYSSGQVFLGAPLAVGQQLVVSYWPVQSSYSDNLQATVIDISADGDLIGGAPVLKAPQVRAGNQLLYVKGQTLANFLQTNIIHGNLFLTGTDADKHVEFMVDQNNHPVQPRDPRYQFMTSQPYASSSYGLFQV